MATVKSIWFLLGVMIVLLASTQIVVVESRALRSTENSMVGECEEGNGAVQPAGMTPLVFGVASNKSSNRPLERSLAYKLASGPSKKGPGH